MKLYLAGPLFTAAELRFNADLARNLRQRGYEVFLPQEQEQRGASARDVFMRDVAGIDWADALVGNMDGPDPDSGTCWEVGYAYRKKPIVLFRTDIRQMTPPFGPYDLMMTQSADVLLDTAGQDFEAVGAAVHNALHELFGIIEER